MDSQRMSAGGGWRDRIPDVAYALVVAGVGLPAVTCVGGPPPQIQPNACIDLLIFDDTLTAAPATGDPGTDVLFSWEAGWVKVPSGSPLPGAFTTDDDIEKTFSVRRESDGEDVPGSPWKHFGTHVPEDHEQDSVRLSELPLQVVLDPGEYIFEVRLDLKEEDCPGCQCANFGHGVEEITFTVTCPCNGVALSQDLRVSSVSTDPASPTAGQSVELQWESEYAGEPCPSEGPISTGAFVERITLQRLQDGAMVGDAVELDAGPLTLGAPPEERSFSLETAPPAGSYRVTVVLDPEGVVDECGDEADNNQAELVVVVEAP